MNILGKRKATYAAELKEKRTVAVLVAVAMVALNVLFTALRTDNSHTVLLLCNIFTDILCGCFLVYFLTAVYFPRKRKLTLYLKYREKHSGTVESIAEETERFMTFDCQRVKIDGQSYFRIYQTLPHMNVGDTVTFYVADNIIVEVAEDE